MLDVVTKSFGTQKMELVAVCENEQIYIFNRAQFAGLISNKATRPWGTRPRNRGRRLVLDVAERGNQHFTVQKSVALGSSRYFVFWFPKPGTFSPNEKEWQGKTASVSDETLVSMAERRVIETALKRARQHLTLENWQKIV